MLLKGERLGYYYDKNEWIFRNLDISVDSGEIIALEAPSGKGKTTIAQILAGYIKPIEGQVYRPTFNTVNPVQLVWQHPEKAVNPKWKLKKTLTEACQPDQSLIERLGIEQQWLERWPNELSGGELQRICVARALHKDTKFLIADEMTSMLDALTQAHIWQVVLEVVRERNIGLIVISHDKHLVDRICNRVVIL
jgi:peptide/nickel transport system ATP-binding protein